MRKKKKKKSNFHFWIMLLLLVGAVFYCIHKEESEMESIVCPKIEIPDGYTVLGIDISHHNGKIDWEKVREQGIEFACIKSTEGISHTNRGFKKNYTSAKRNGIIAGMYHFFIFRKDGAEQACFFLEKLKYEAGDLPPVVDVEYDSGNRRSKDKSVNRKRIEELRRFDSVVFEQLHIHPIIYTNKECYDDLICKNFPDNDLWLASLTDEPDEEYHANWVIWQYSHTGKVKGISGLVDLNVFYSNKEDFKQWIKAN
ncbi:MAG: glycoside hydrolase family 25 protein [Prevotellaceae bacterium]|jgi:lysozyme|nr:glycoside hydrolase family 25 protein [Prevotellaceae bacterium]